MDDYDRLVTEARRSSSPSISQSSDNIMINSNNYPNMTLNSNSNTTPPSMRTLGMFLGVIVPCCLSMFSIVVFLRVGYLIGYSGISGAFILLITSYLIVVMTVFSLCALCTNGAIESGGAYYMISRTLGPEFGAAIGLLFFIANVASCALYIFGGVEMLIANFGEAGGSQSNFLPEGYWFSFLYASAILLVCTSICIVGSNAYSKSISVVGTVVLVCIVSIFISFFTTESFEMNNLPNNHTALNYTGITDFKNNWKSNNLDLTWERIKTGIEIDYISGEVVSLLTVFGVFFNGCIGVMAGVNVSGELIQPNKAIPKGTIIAVMTTFMTYSMLILFISGTCSHELLISHYTVLQTVNFCPILIFSGVMLVSISSVMSNMIGASRVLYAIGLDKVFGNPDQSFFVKIITMVSQNGTNPIGSVLLTYTLIQLFLLYSQINMIAPLVTIFFLLAYASVDAACFALTITSAPNFRPTFSFFNKYTCGVGMLATIIMMILVSPFYAMIATIIFVAIFVMISCSNGNSKKDNSYAWGHISQALIYHQVRKYLLRLDSRKDHVKYWRPQFLLLCKNHAKSSDIIFANDLKKSGLLIVGHLVGDADVKRADCDEISQNFIPKWMELIDYLNVKAFTEITRSRSIREGSEQLLRISGLGGMRPNTLILGFPGFQVPKFMENSQFIENSSGVLDNTEATLDSNPNSYPNTVLNCVPNVPIVPKSALNFSGPSEFVGILKDALKMDKNIVILRNMNRLNKLHSGFIDVWPVELLANFNNLLENSTVYDEELSILDNCSHFILQLACVLSMAEKWKKYNITPRIMLPIPTSEWKNQANIAKKVEVYLKDTIRIKNAKVFPIELGSWLTPEGEQLAENRAENWAELIECQQHRTVVTFLYLPKPKEVGVCDLSGDEHLLSVEGEGSSISLPDDEFCKILTRLSDRSGPTVMVHGLKDVISTDF